jgi:hypothetical protein
VARGVVRSGGHRRRRIISLGLLLKSLTVAVGLFALCCKSCVTSL